MASSRISHFSRFEALGRLALGASALALVWLVGCSQEATPCYPGDYVACACGAEPRGVAVCGAAGAGYETCDCSGAITAKLRDALEASAQAAVDAGERDSGSLTPFMSPCETNEECTTGLCFAFNAKGPHCSKTCRVTSDCEAPSTGCSLMGVCKVP